MRQGIYMYTNGDQVELVELISTWWDCYTSKWEIRKISMTSYNNTDGDRIEQRTSSVEHVFKNMEYLGKI